MTRTTNGNVNLARCRGERGQALLEFALVAPLVFLFLFLVIDFGIAINRSIVISHAAREAARFGAVGADEADIVQRAVDQSQGLLTDSNIDVSWADGPGGNPSAGQPGGAVQVKVDYEYALWSTKMPFFGIGLDLSFPLTSCADMRQEVGATPTGTGDIC
jgi:Flp pilus assembly protein TadG